jgi:RHH-type transcriptional regulator, proline utilization regulon repressor / proline dehydrogenase / delta 1-pyrroline-5-carboxylate dehydrogenase
MAGRCRCYAQKHETDANFEQFTEFLLGRQGAVASWRWRAIIFGESRMRWRWPNIWGWARARSNFSCCTAWPRVWKRRLWIGGQRVRLYAPVGKLLPGMAYLVRRLLENTSNQGFLRVGDAGTRAAMRSC